MLIQLATLPGRDDRANEDFAGAFPGCAVLLDGAGGPAEMPSGCTHGTAWYVRQLGARLLAGMETSLDRDLTDLLADGITAVSETHRDTCDLDAPGTPASVVIMARTANGILEYLVLGDSTLVIDAGDADGDLTVITDRRIDDVAKAERLEMEDLPTGTSEHQAARIRFVGIQRSLRNKPGGYWTASTDPRAAREAYTGTVPLSGIRHVTLLSDGTARFTEFGLGTWRDLLELLDAYGPSSVFARIRQAEESDPAGTRWPRAKRTDDVAVVHFTSQGRDESGRPDPGSRLARRLGEWDQRTSAEEHAGRP
jgi:hypothetical protein